MGSWVLGVVRIFKPKQLSLIPKSPETLSISSGVKVDSSRKFPQAPNATHVGLLNSLVLI